jgi:HAD superfamily hydrolase (TIGR01509 family)
MAITETRAVFWDNDGVLVDTEHLYFEASRRAVADIPFDLNEELYGEYFLRQNTGIWHLLPPLGCSEKMIEALKTRRNELYARLLASADVAIPEALEVLAQLHGRLSMGIVTSCQPEHFAIIHRQADILQYMDFVITPDHYNNSKPDPEPYLLAVQRSGVMAEHCLVIEDSERGLAAACAAGLRCWVVPSRLTQGCRFDGAERILDSLEEIPRLLLNR